MMKIRLGLLATLLVSLSGCFFYTAAVCTSKNLMDPPGFEQGFDLVSPSEGETRHEMRRLEKGVYELQYVEESGKLNPTLIRFCKVGERKVEAHLMEPVLLSEAVLKTSDNSEFLFAMKVERDETRGVLLLRGQEFDPDQIEKLQIPNKVSDYGIIVDNAKTPLADFLTILKDSDSRPPELHTKQ